MIGVVCWLRSDDRFWPGSQRREDRTPRGRMPQAIRAQARGPGQVGGERAGSLILRPDRVTIRSSRNPCSGDPPASERCLQAPEEISTMKAIPEPALCRTAAALALVAALVSGSALRAQEPNSDAKEDAGGRLAEMGRVVKK